jgi:uncharacterized protein (DUF2062 family)
VKDWLRRRFVEPLLTLLSQGADPKRLAICVAIGVVVGNIPILGVSTILCTFIALAFRLNLPAIQLVQGAMAPIQVLLIIPYVRLGERMMGAAPEPLSVAAATDLISHGVGHAVYVLREAILHAGVAFLAVGPVATFALYRVLMPVFTRAALAGRKPRPATGPLP